jgi:hypothetical protein
MSTTKRFLSSQVSHGRKSRSQVSLAHPARDESYTYIPSCITSYCIVHDMSAYTRIAMPMVLVGDTMVYHYRLRHHDAACSIRDAWPGLVKNSITHQLGTARTEEPPNAMTQRRLWCMLLSTTSLWSSSPSPTCRCHEASGTSAETSSCKCLSRAVAGEATACTSTVNQNKVWFP